MATEAPAPATDLVLRTEKRRQESSVALDSVRRGKLGQFFTPSPAADFIASLARLPEAGILRILDPGAGTGSLTASLVARVLEERPGAEISVTACEVDPQLHPALQATLDDCVNTAIGYGASLEVNLVLGDFIAWATEGDGLFGQPPQLFDLVVMNPPYKKLAASSRERNLVSAVCAETSNLYSAFMALGVHLLSPGGQLLAITPRSFANGPYFRPFRQYFLKRMHIDRVHVFETRNKVFADAAVLQENVITVATRMVDVERKPVVVSASRSYSEEVRQRSVPYAEMVHPGDPESFIHISADEEGTELAAAHASLSATLPDLRLKVSTGRVVDFRSKEYLRPHMVDGAVPLIYPLHMREGAVKWPALGAKKNNAILLNEETEKLTFPLGHYVVVKRLSSKEEKHRVVAAVFDPEQVPCERIGFENHVNVFHMDGAGLPAETARGLCIWLNSTILDRFIRRFNGHTQVNATDLRNLRYPSMEQLSAMGRSCRRDVWPGQEEIDELIRQNVK
ncbi:Eco57I restriction-modification methylase domain-containing protein [Streptomyces sp. B1866]|uniref:Eco57I restriction-modification methylase domain-containing protein n=1 Tax=Streptomyces sp. B1866 TaxID=3075431 RepID=UPI00288DB6A9|nr:Eco57I restriction-modification methylase domain-containing protein [Streptomyces sp. B1866]MDT3395064.1 Eco57I restriction-modification methylase domain-containing protein [Streptomyces sp. B1866]